MNHYLLAPQAAILLSACALWPVGEDPRGLKYKTAANAVLVALTAFYRENGVLPRELAELAPRHIASIPTEPSLFLDAQRQLLVFDYSATWPSLGKVSCAAAVGASNWTCVGYL
jgi:hypothetical protein